MSADMIAITYDYERQQDDGRASQSNAGDP
jgi:hypothetical protein